MKKQQKRRASAAAQQKQAEAVQSAPLVHRERSSASALTSSGAYTTPPTVIVGDVLHVMGEERVVVYVNDSRAATVPVRSSLVTWKERADGATVWDYWSKGAKIENISPRSAAQVLRHLSADEMKANFSGAASAVPAANTAENAASERTQETMKKRHATQATGGVRAATPEQMSGVAVAEKPAPAKGSDSKKGKAKEKSSDSATPAPAVSMAGRSALIKKLATDGKHADFDSVYAAVNAKFPGSSPANVKKVYQKAVAASK